MTVRIMPLGSMTNTARTAFVLDSVSAGVGFNAEIEDQRWDRLRVRFHGQVDTRKRAKLRPGQRVVFAGETVELIAE